MLKVEQSFESRREEQSDRDRRLNERETLLNSQLARMMESEKELKQQMETLEKKSTALENAQQELIQLTRERREQLQTLANMSAVEARAALLKEVEQESGAASFTRTAGATWH